MTHDVILLYGEHIIRVTRYYVNVYELYEYDIKSVVVVVDTSAGARRLDTFNRYA